MATPCGVLDLPVWSRTSTPTPVLVVRNFSTPDLHRQRGAFPEGRSGGATAGVSPTRGLVGLLFSGLLRRVVSSFLGRPLGLGASARVEKDR